MGRQGHRIFMLTGLVISVIAIANPGVLLSVPFPLSPPALELGLPFAVGDVVVSNLELTAVEVRQVDYTWRLTAAYAEVNVSKAVVSFDWYYKKEKGKGFFIEDELRLDFDWNFTITKSSRFELEITRTKIRPGKSKVELGGGATETVAVEVTNLILNHASITFRGIIGNKISSALTDASKILGEDILIYHDKVHNKNIKINTTLVAAPLLNGQTLFLQVNAAPYVEGERSDFLNPPEVLVKQNSTKIQLQVHKLLVTRIIEAFLRIKGAIDVQFQSTTITSTIDIDSLALSNIFPPMAFYPQNRDVVFSISIPTITFDFDLQNFKFQFKGRAMVSTQDQKTKVRTLYMNPINASASIEISTIFGPQLSNLRIANLEVLSFDADLRDVSQGLIVPGAISQYFPELMGWVADAVNFELNKKAVGLSYKNIHVGVKGKVVNGKSYNVQIDLK